MRLITSSLALSLLIGATPYVHAQQDRAGDLPLPRLLRITDDVYTIENANPVIPELGAFGGNVTIYLTDDGVILVDTKFDRMHDFVMEQVATLTDEPIEIVILTHNHADHSGAAALMQAHGATVIISAADSENLARGGAETLPQIGYSGEMKVTLGGKEVLLREFRGHTRGDTVAYLPAARIVVAGDLVTTADSIPVIVNYADGGTWSDLGRTLDEIAAMDFDFLVGGHGPVISKQQFIALRDRLARMRERFRELNRADTGAEEIAAILMSEFGWRDPIGTNLPGMLQELR